MVGNLLGISEDLGAGAGAGDGGVLEALPFSRRRVAKVAGGKGARLMNAALMREAD